ncbi:5-(carboxyamino)imidazole ribonucleotide mutase [bacterium]|nr:5-(carboxyamino)imidazole ribonucleotide mutase [bacterium]
MAKNGKVLILIGSKSDWEVMKEAKTILEEAGVEVLLSIASAHRTPKRVQSFCERCEEGEFDLVICGAGMAAHLAGVVASHTLLPVIGVPLGTGGLLGLDALLSTVQMPPGVPVATVGINSAKNAAFLALRILSLKYPQLRDFLIAHREKTAREVETSAEEIEGK